MRTLVVLGFIIINHFALTQVNPNHLQVRGYVKADGTYVQPHYRTEPNNTVYDNFSTFPNVNPYTGQVGTKYYSTPQPPAEQSTYYYSTPTYSLPTQQSTYYYLNPGYSQPAEQNSGGGLSITLLTSWIFHLCCELKK